MVSFYYVEKTRSPGVRIIFKGKWCWADDLEDAVCVSRNTWNINVPDRARFKKSWCRSRSLGCRWNKDSACAGAKEFIFLEIRRLIEPSNELILQHCMLAAGRAKCLVCIECINEAEARNARSKHSSRSPNVQYVALFENRILNSVWKSNWIIQWVTFDLHTSQYVCIYVHLLLLVCALHCSNTSTEDCQILLVKGRKRKFSNFYTLPRYGWMIVDVGMPYEHPSAIL